MTTVRGAVHRAIGEALRLQDSVIPWMLEEVEGHFCRSYPHTLQYVLPVELLSSLVLDCLCVQRLL